MKTELRQPREMSDKTKNMSKSGNQHKKMTGKVRLPKISVNGLRTNTKTPQTFLQRNNLDKNGSAISVTE